MQSPPAFVMFRREPEPLSQPPREQEYYGYRQFVVAHHNLPHLSRYEGSMPLLMACKGIVKVQLRSCDNHSRSFIGADDPFEGL